MGAGTAGGAGSALAHFGGLWFVGFGEIIRLTRKGALGVQQDMKGGAYLICCLKGTRGSNLAGSSGSSGNCLAGVRPEVAPRLMLTTPHGMDQIYLDCMEALVLGLVQAREPKYLKPRLFAEDLKPEFGIGRLSRSGHVLPTIQIYSRNTYQRLHASVS